MTMFYIEWRGTNGNNFNQGREGQEVIAIVDHIMQGTMESTDNWFKDAKSKASTQYGIAKDGRIYQWVVQTNRAWGNGVVNKGPETPAWVLATLSGGTNAGVNVNDLTISIEHEGWYTEEMPEAQYQATLYLHRYLVGLHKIPLDRQHIIGHYQIDYKTRRNCPGPNFPWDRLLADLAAEPEFNPNPKGLSVGPGMLAKLKEIKETAHTAEQYFRPAPGQPPGLTESSRLWTDQGSFLVAIQDLLPDGKTPAATWTVRRYKEV